MKPLEYDDATGRRLFKALRDRYNQKTLPPFWRMEGDPPSPFALSFVKVSIANTVQLRCFVEIEHHPDDGRDWLHLSISGAHGLPSWSELVEARDAFLGKETQAVQVLAPVSEHVNIHPHCLHLWAHLDGSRVVGDLRREGGGI